MRNVLQAMQDDLLLFGHTTVTMVDTRSEFAILRHNPFEVEFI